MGDLKYKGANQPGVTSGDGWMSRLGKLLGGGGGASTYEGDGQPALRTAGFFSSTAPVYRQAPLAPPAREAEHLVVECPPGDESAAQAVGSYSVERDPSASLPIAILVPRPR